jgi:hypothetical protein
MKTTAILMGISISLMAGACATEPTIEDELAGESEADGAGDGKADVVNTYGYLHIRPDYRKCAAPMCGGYFVSRVNRSSTQCADGSYADACYVADADFDGLGLNNQQLDRLLTAVGANAALVRGFLDEAVFPGGGDRTFGTLSVTEAWVAGTTNDAEGPYLHAEFTPLACITFPCPSIRERKLNSDLSAMIADLDFTQMGATDAEMTAASQALHSDEGVIVTGYRTEVTGPAGAAKAREATQFFTRLVGEPEATCFVGGCSGQICSDREGVVSTCEWKPSYACFDTAACERQLDGECGWTPTPELDACLDAAPF